VEVRCYNQDVVLTDSRFTALVVFPGTNPEDLVFTSVSNGTSASHTPDLRFSYNTEGGEITAERSATGTYEVVLGGLGAVAETTDGGLGHVQVVSHASAGEICKIASWKYAGSDLSIDVLCYDNAGPADSRYDVLGLWPRSKAGSVAYVYANDPTSPSYEPSNLWAYNPSSGPITIVRHDVGTYAVTFAGFGSEFTAMSGGRGTVQVTPYGAPFESDYCSITAWTAGIDPTISVKCFEQFGSFVAPADTRFTLMLLVRKAGWVDETDITFESFDDGAILTEIPTAFGKLSFPLGVEIIECSVTDDSCVRARSGSKVVAGESIDALTRDPFVLEFELPHAEVGLFVNGVGQDGVLYDYAVVLKDSTGADIGSWLPGTLTSAPAWGSRVNVDLGENLISRVEVWGDSRPLLGDQGLILVDDLSYRRAASSIGTEDEVGASERGLHQNFPNPFAVATTISYELANASEVVLTVFDVLGREVITRHEGRRAPGRHDLLLTLPDVPRGVYFYRIRADGHSEAGRMILAR
jgi:hypothetical protein